MKSNIQKAGEKSPPQPTDLVKAVCTKCESIHTKNEGAQNIVYVDDKPYMVQLCPKCKEDLFKKINDAAMEISAEYMKPYITEDKANG